jgi:hypothetical protein
MLFLIPAPLAAPAEQGGGFGPSFGPPGEQASSRFAHLHSEPEAAATTEEAAPVVEAPAPPPEPELLHIPCPNGHELETPLDMLEQEVLCPTCNAQFRLRKKDSREYKRKKEEAEQLKEIKTGNLWLNIAIVAVVLVGLLVVGLITMTALGGTKGLPPKSKKSTHLAPRDADLTRSVRSTLLPSFERPVNLDFQ